MMTELEHKITLDEMGRLYFKCNIRYLRLYMKKYSISYQRYTQYHKISIKYVRTDMCNGCTYISILCKVEDCLSSTFSECIPINNIELFKLISKKIRLWKD